MTTQAESLVVDNIARWHILQISGPLDEEFASAMADLAPVTAWQPRRTILPTVGMPYAPILHLDAGGHFLKRSFPLLRGYARQPFAAVARIGTTLAGLLQAYSSTPQDVLVCTAPYFAPVAEQWAGPVVYWLTDRISSYPSSNGIDIAALDKRMCRAATLLCPNSSRLRDYLVHEAGANSDNILVVPNATREQNILSIPLFEPAPLPSAAAGLRRPVAGVIGNLAGNLDWLLLDAATRKMQEVQWLFVGPADMEIADWAHRDARQRVMERSNTMFVGRQPYGELVHYARSFDVAVLPYRKCEPTYSGSSTRFYEHLAACRPMFATRAFEELLHKEPYLTLVDTAEELVNAIDELSRSSFTDPFISMRWHASITETWHTRASAVYERLREQVSHASWPDSPQSMQQQNRLRSSSGDAGDRLKPSTCNADGCGV